MVSIQDENSSQRFEHLFLRSRSRIYTLAYRIMGNADDAEDVTQDAFVRAWDNFARYDPSRPFEAWLYRIVTNRALDIRTRRRRVPMLSLENTPGEQEGSYFINDVTDWQPNPEQTVIDKMMVAYLIMTLHELPDEYQELLLLVAQDHTYTEIATLVGYPIGTVRSRIARGRARLQRLLAADPT